MALGSATDRWTKVPVPKLRRGIPEETAGSTWVDQDVGLLSYVCSACSINTCLFPANMKCVSSMLNVSTELQPSPDPATCSTLHRDRCLK